ncbi:MAG TPA: cytochrome c1 [Gammaproteobacteria bacterium]|nr:cytochrome c1 [Gammaproteobacteria bacterium]
MQKTSLTTYLIIFLSCTFAFAHQSNQSVRLETPAIDVHDQASLDRGAKFFAQKCLACHSLKYLPHNPTALQANINQETMPVWDKSAWSGHPPPDLSLVIPVKGADWVYTFLRSYYVDETKPTGFGNLLWPKTSMPNPFAAEEGKKILIKKFNHEDIYGEAPPYYRVLKLQETGLLTSGEFDQSLVDLVAFLTHAGEPNKDDRERMGGWVLLFLGIMIGLTYALYRVYWIDIKK